MMDHQQTDLLKGLDAMPVGSAPLDALLIGGKSAERRQRRTLIAGAAAVSLLVIGGGAVATQAITGSGGQGGGDSLVADESDVQRQEGNIEGRAETPTECRPEIRLNGTTYFAAGYTELRGTRFAAAIAADCADVGPSPGSEFTEDSEQVAVWSLPGYSTGDVVATRFDADSFIIFVSDATPSREVGRVVRELSPSEG